MKKLSILQAVSILHLLLTTIWSLVYFNEMNDGKGWGSLITFGLLGIGVLGLMTSWLTGILCKKFILDQPRRIQNTIEAAFVVGFILFVAIKY